MGQAVHQLNTEGQLVEEINDAVKKGNEHFKTAGAKLKQLKFVVQAKRPRIAWAKYLEENCHMRVSRANQLIRIAEGRTTVKRERADVAARAAKQKKKMDDTIVQSFEEARSSYIITVKSLSKTERINEVHKLLDAFGLSLHKDFVHTLAFKRQSS